MSLKCTMILGDCLDVMPSVGIHGAHMVYADLPYSTGAAGYTKQLWDKPFDVNLLMTVLDSVCGPDAMRVFAANDRLAAKLAHEHKKDFRYSIIWEKPRASLYFHASRRPLLAHEMIQVFGPSSGTYNAQTTAGKPYVRYTNSRGDGNQHETGRTDTDNIGIRQPRSVVFFCGNHGRQTVRTHPTQKPLALLDWLIRTYSNSKDVVLDPASGSGTTAVAAMLSGRSSICIEKDQGYFDASVDRVMQTAKRNLIDVKIEVIT